MSFINPTTGQMVHAEIKKISWWHQSIVDLMLLHPEMTNNEMAAHFKVTPPWLSTVKNSDAFKAYFELRRQAHQASVSDSIIEKTEKLANLGLDVLQERIQAERETIGLGGVLDTTKAALMALGFGGQAKGPQAILGAPGSVNVQVNVDASVLEGARQKMFAASAAATEKLQLRQDRPGEPVILEGSSREVSSAPAA